MLTNMLKEQRRGTKESLIVLLIFSNILTALYFIGPSALPFKGLDQSKLLETIMTMFVVSVFMERAVEAILVPMRTPGRQQIEHAMESIESFDAADKATLLREKKCELDEYRIETAKYAYWISFVFGLVISLAGVRALNGLVDIAPGNSSMFFSFVDVIITGGVISGGSAAIDKMGRKISKTLNLTSATTSIVKPPQDSAAAETPVNPAAN
jgi:hypothetical protein